MQTIARRCLLNLYQEQFAVCDDHPSDARTAAGGSPKSRDGYAQRGSRDLNEGSDGGNAGSQTSRHADGPFTPHGPHLEGAVLGHGYDERDHSRLREIDPIDWLTAFFERLPLLYRNFAQMAAEQR